MALVETSEALVVTGSKKNEEIVVGSMVVYTYDGEEVEALTPEQEETLRMQAEDPEYLDIDGILKNSVIDLDDTKKHVEVFVERRYVYCCEMYCGNAPYYLSHTHNRVLVIDRARIDFFPQRGVVPPEWVGKIKDYHFVPPPPAEEVVEVEAAPIWKRVGYTLVQIPRRNEDTWKIEFFTERRDVFTILPPETPEKAEEEKKEEEEEEKAEGVVAVCEEPKVFFVMSGERQMLVCPSSVRFIRPDGSEAREERTPVPRPPRSEYFKELEEEEAALEEALRRAKECPPPPPPAAEEVAAEGQEPQEAAAAPPITEEEVVA